MTQAPGAVEQITATPAPRPPARATWVVALIAALVGIAATGTQIVEKIAILTEPSTTLVCDVNSVLSCTNVLKAWQSSVLGPPNALIGAIMFTVFLTAALTRLLGSRHSAGSLLFLTGLAVFFAAFATWFMQQTAFVISALCLWCIGITTAVIVIGACLTRTLARDLGERQDRVGGFVRAITAGGRDIIVWVAWWILVAALLIVGLGF